MILFDFILKIQSHENQCIISKLILYNFFALSQTKTPSFVSPLDASRRVSQEMSIHSGFQLEPFQGYSRDDFSRIHRHEIVMGGRCDSPSFFSHSSAVGAEEGDTGSTQSPSPTRKTLRGSFVGVGTFGTVRDSFELPKEFRLDSGRDFQLVTLRSL